MTDRVYCYPDSDVLINKLGIRDQKQLHITERKLTMLRLLEIIEKPIKGQFDFVHLQAIHKYIFQKSMHYILFGRETGEAKESLFAALHSEMELLLIFRKYRKKK